MTDEYLEAFIEESNKIEGITDYDRDEQYDAYMQFLNLDKIIIADIQGLAFALYKSSYNASLTPLIRDQIGFNVRVGTHRPPPGGPDIEKKLQRLLNIVNKQSNSSSAYRLHCEYEKLHPLTDCNGRTGRAIWLWLMMKDGTDLRLGFLHRWYYQSLDSGRKR